MGWGTDFTADIYLNRLIFDSIYELEDTIQNCKDEIEEYNRALLMYASSNPKDIIPEEWKDEPINFMRIEVSRILRELEDEIKHLKDLEYYLQYLKENNITHIKPEN